MLDGRFGEGVNGDFLSGGDAHGVEHHGGGAVADHDFTLFPESFDHGQHILVVRLSGVFPEFRYSVTTAEHKSVELVLVSFQVSNHVICHEGNAGIRLDFFRFCHCKYFIGNAIFEKCFQILEQTEPVYRVNCQYGYFFCHG